MNAEPEQILSPADGPAFELEDGAPDAPLVLICEHASARIPAALGDLGLLPEDRLSHAAWDPGARKVAAALAEAFRAPLLAARFSRLVYDLNRPPEAASAIPAKSERVAIPGNADLADAARTARIDALYHPFHTEAERVLAARGDTPLITIHSFTPVFDGARRATELGFLHDADDRLAQALLTASKVEGGFLSELNAPYSAADGVTHTLERHGTRAGRSNAMIEIRNDLIADEAGVRRVAEHLARALATVLAVTPERTRHDA
ncbi:N-formylglutamate amidohydrolase [Litorisediminicola beolgyonensis]|uniref:N-formylglutamate amidohydrolase n=1 Tax=Litorisediminicola beolgyonensis TaxID=1173614 RepID=A0ABW3ZCG5_9RHOB